MAEDKPVSTGYLQAESLLRCLNTFPVPEHSVLIDRFVNDVMTGRIIRMAEHRLFTLRDHFNNQGQRHHLRQQGMNPVTVVRIQGWIPVAPIDKQGIKAWYIRDETYSAAQAELVNAQKNDLWRHSGAMENFIVCWTEFSGGKSRTLFGPGQSEIRSGAWSAELYAYFGPI